jgi:hypothetical protein
MASLEKGLVAQDADALASGLPLELDGAEVAQKLRRPIVKGANLRTSDSPVPGQLLEHQAAIAPHAERDVAWLASSFTHGSRCPFQGADEGPVFRLVAGHVRPEAETRNGEALPIDRQLVASVALARIAEGAPIEHHLHLDRR